MNNTIYYNDLFDIYGELLTEKEKEYFKLYYFDNLSLSEISDNNNVSRNAVHKSIKTVEDKLKFYENKLHGYELLNELHKLNNPSIEDILSKL